MLSGIGVVIGKLSLLSIILAGPAWIVAARRGYFSKWEVSLPLIVTVTWSVLAGTIGTKEKTLGNLAEPVIACLVVVASIYTKTFVLNRFVQSKHMATAFIVAFCVVVTIGIVFLVPPLPE